MNKQLAQLLKQIGTTSLEIYRQELCSVPLFEPYTVFMRLDQKGSGFLIIDQIEDFLRDHDCHYNNYEVEALWKFMDSDQDGVVDYQELILKYIYSFLRYCLPQANPHIAQLVILRESFYIQPMMLLPQEVELGLLKMIQYTIEWRCSLIQLSQILKESTSYSKLSLFKQIQGSNKGYFIDIDDLKDFMAQNDVEMTQQEAVFVFNNVDCDRDGIINYKEFSCNILFENEQQQILYKRSEVKELDDEINQLFPPEVFTTPTKNKKFHLSSPSTSIPKQSTKERTSEKQAFPLPPRQVLLAINDQLKISRELSQVTRVRYQIGDLEEVMQFTPEFNLDQEELRLKLEALNIFTQAEDIAFFIKQHGQDGHITPKQFMDLFTEQDLNRPQQALTPLDMCLFKKAIYAHLIASVSSQRIRGLLQSCITRQGISLKMILCGMTHVSLEDIKSLLENFQDLMTMNDIQETKHHFGI